eukprot:CAMPEP_0178397378 /NCGR_PEP_ID=MMETSP0689_2-20121128/14213_1 /TAXON_ID=160604 /ORGANISM="Amphidinium massartii, Strain CS-259" /LENGTH=1158 /DNA_ID=CAMNT_0020018081 /DNA_START=1 /DNA_END=3475 /DNA_ORIENTATION=+
MASSSSSSDSGSNRSRSGSTEEAFGGYSETWREPREAAELQCPICLLVPCEALAHKCGKLVCESCWQTWHAAEERRLPRCPWCRQELQRDSKDVAPAFHERFRIANLEIVCGLCSDELRLGNKQTHLRETCRRRSVACVKCGQEQPFEEMEEHMRLRCDHRPIECPACGAPTTHHGLQEHRLTDCLHRLVVCQLCSDLVAADEMDKHLQENAGRHIAALVTEAGELRKEVKNLKEASSKPRYPGNSTRGRLWHPGTIKPKPCYIGRKNYAAKRFACGYNFDEFWRGWSWRPFVYNVPDILAEVYQDETWSCCGCPWDGQPCTTRSLDEMPPEEPAVDIKASRFKITMVALDVEWVKEQSSPIWTEKMAHCCGKVGQAKVADPDGTVQVEFRIDGCKELWWFPAAVLQEGLAAFPVGAAIKVDEDVDWVRSTCRHFWEWGPSMSQGCGQVGRVEELDAQHGVVKVRLRDRTAMYYHALVLQPVADEDVPDSSDDQGEAAAPEQAAGSPQQEQQQDEEQDEQQESAQEGPDEDADEQVQDDPEDVTVWRAVEDVCCRLLAVLLVTAYITFLLKCVELAVMYWTTGVIGSFTLLASDIFAFCALAAIVLSYCCFDWFFDFDVFATTFWELPDFLVVAFGWCTLIMLFLVLFGLVVSLVESAAGWLFPASPQRSAPPDVTLLEGLGVYLNHREIPPAGGKLGVSQALAAVPPAALAVPPAVVEALAAGGQVFDNIDNFFLARLRDESSDDASAVLNGFYIGASVKVMDDVAWVNSRLRQSPLAMQLLLISAEYCGQVGRVRATDSSDGTLLVRFGGGESLWCPASLLQLCSSPGCDVAEAEDEDAAEHFDLDEDDFDEDDSDLAALARSMTFEHAIPPPAPFADPPASRTGGGRRRRPASSVSQLTKRTPLPLPKQAVLRESSSPSLRHPRGPCQPEMPAAATWGRRKRTYGGSWWHSSAASQRSCRTPSPVSSISSTSSSTSTTVPSCSTSSSITTTGTSTSGAITELTSTTGSFSEPEPEELWDNEKDNHVVDDLLSMDTFTPGHLSSCVKDMIVEMRRLTVVFHSGCIGQELEFGSRSVAVTMSWLKHTIAEMRLQGAIQWWSAYWRNELHGQANDRSLVAVEAWTHHAVRHLKLRLNSVLNSFTYKIKTEDASKGSLW